MGVRKLQLGQDQIGQDQIGQDQICWSNPGPHSSLIWALPSGAEGTGTQTKEDRMGSLCRGEAKEGGGWGE